MVDSNMYIRLCTKPSQQELIHILQQVSDNKYSQASKEVRFDFYSSHS